jgi:hypothetical protein
MARLEPCPGCQRHVKIDEPRCPFCETALGEHFGQLPARAMPTKRLGRAALFAFGVGATSPLIASCAADHKDDDEKQNDGGADDEGDGEGDGDDGNIQPAYGLPADDASVPEADAGQPPADDEDDGTTVALYGGAPSD